MEETKTEEIKKEVVVAEDRSAFNCPQCVGEGLVLVSSVHKICPTCIGTGKV